MSFHDPYASQDIFGGAGGHARRKAMVAPEVPADEGLVVESAVDGYVGAVVGFEKLQDADCVKLEDRRGRVRHFPARSSSTAAASR